MAGDVGWWGLSASLLLVVITIAVSMWRRLGLERDVAEATVRALVQLLAVGYVLTFVLEHDRSNALAFAWLAFMVLVAAFTVSRRAPEVPGVLPLAATSLATSTSVVSLIIFGLGIFPLEAQAMIPVGGMMIGNAMTSAVSAGRRVVAELTEKRAEVEARLALGQPWRLASRPMLRAALRTAMVTQIESTKAVGLVTLPGTMTGLILAGVDPVDAVLVQAAVMFLLLGTVAINVVVIGSGVTRRLFTPDHRLVRLARPVP